MDLKNEEVYLFRVEVYRLFALFVRSLAMEEMRDKPLKSA